MSTTVYVQAMNVHVGGGRSLLLPLLAAITPQCPVVALLDRRMALPSTLPANLTVKWVEPSVLGRLQAERWLRRAVSDGDRVLCFGNLPPLNALKGRVLVFVQNRYLIEELPLSGFPVSSRLRLHLERLWLKHCARHADRFVVQTQSMQRLLCATLAIPESRIDIWPFAALPSNHAESERPGTSNQARFIYAASGEPHKNHRQLIEAWCLLARDGLRPRLTLTLDPARFPELWGWIEQQVKKDDLDVHNLGFLPHAELIAAYSTVDALVYPSHVESFGIPLLEAKNAGLAVLAPELDYVRDVVQPDQSFDSRSAISIARAVRRHLGQATAALPVMSASDFLNRVTNEVH